MRAPRQAEKSHPSYVMPEDSLRTHEAAEETESSLGEVIIPFRTNLSLQLIGCWGIMRCHSTGFFLFGFGLQRWTSVHRSFRVLMRMLCGRGSNDDVAESRDSPLVAF
ncbi:BZ3500_MvSof-1268-A1-R1_Chr12-2g03786 [Microbotryum saponariae]|uniref:BZ3500_MvSof-1268-A1-R1_Chr12-2g03786 protein n=1 Tax=Microbotryum saponariae TaxID=289078 RepID=A0A2X0MJ63_9BASI|nr:BZ3500_MvSof-1268-A1-R1_Chr12-2g03786 [Microbotryum saponariae]